MRFDRRASGKTALMVRAQQPPLQVVRAFSLPDGTALVHLHNVSGGVLGGDLLELDVQVGPRAHVQLTSTGATRVYRCRVDMPTAVQTTQIRVEHDGLLEYVPDPLIPFAGACYRQHTQIDLAPGAGFFWWEMLSPGREAHNEVFAYELVQLTTQIVAEGRPVSSERLKLQPKLRPLTSPARFGAYRYSVTFYICRVGLPVARWLALEAQLLELAGTLSCSGDVVWGVSTLPVHGLVVRALSRGGRPLAPGLLAFWQAAKQELYGQAAVAPRKVY